MVTKSARRCPASSEARRTALRRNRLAANRYRRKQKEGNAQLEMQYQESFNKNRSLVAAVTNLRLEVLTLQDEMFKHAYCMDEPIETYLSEMARLISHAGNEAIVDEPGSLAVPEIETTAVFSPTLAFDAWLELVQDLGATTPQFTWDSSLSDFPDIFSSPW
ncbi:hypothetical protein BBP40_007358 [Aspergillus hancockii]|nr:hypothetical protein BBP40_007358 [Aspergillus hancockii]